MGTKVGTKTKKQASRNLGKPIVKLFLALFGDWVNRSLVFCKCFFEISPRKKAPARQSQGF